MYRQIDKQRNCEAMTVDEFPAHIKVGLCSDIISHNSWWMTNVMHKFSSMLVIHQESLYDARSTKCKIISHTWNRYRKEEL